MKEHKGSVFVITHKRCFFSTPNNYIPIQVGAANTGEELPYINDESGESIADKNKNFCELTAWYWLWKNYDLPSYVGLCHYRRFFMKPTAFGIHVINEKDISDIFEKGYDIVLPLPTQCNMTVKEFYYKHGEGRQADIELVERIIQERYPEYEEAMNAVFNSHQSSYWNLAIMKREDFKAYCEWLFDVLFCLETQIDLSGYTAAQARIYGYLSEILINVWVKHKELKVFYSPMSFVDANRIKNCLRKCRIWFRMAKQALKI